MKAVNPSAFSGSFDITEVARPRHTAKTYHPMRRITGNDVEKIRQLLRFSPSSINVQPWHFIFASTEEGKASVARSTERRFPFTSPSILNASYIVVFASRLDLPEPHLQRVLDQEVAGGRFAWDPETFTTQMHAGRSMFANIHKQDMKDLQHWIDKQVYLNLGQFLPGIAAPGIDAMLMKGIEAAVLDEEFGLREKGFSALLVVPPGSRDDAADHNANLPKSRQTYADMLTEV